MKTKKQTDEIRKVVRDILARDPFISSRALQREVSNRLRVPVGRNYIMALVKKVNGELAYEAKHNPDVQDRVRQTMELFRVSREKLARIAFWNPEMARSDSSMLFMPSYKHQIEAIKALAVIEKLGLEMEMDAGIYQRHLGTIDHRAIPLPIDVKMQIWAAMEAWGFEMPMLRADVREIKNDGEPSTPQPTAALDAPGT